MDIQLWRWSGVYGSQSGIRTRPTRYIGDIRFTTRVAHSDSGSHGHVKERLPSTVGLTLRRLARAALHALFLLAILHDTQTAVLRSCETDSYRLTGFSGQKLNTEYVQCHRPVNGRRPSVEAMVLAA